MDELNRIIANNISTLRTLNKMTQSQLAEKLNYTDKLVSKWERGESAPNAFTLKQLSEIFGVTVDYLFTDHKNEEDSPKPKDEKDYRVSKRIVTAISICGTWLLAFLVFIILWIIDKPFLSIFVYTIPVSFIVLLVLNSVWNEGKRNCYIIAGLLVGIALTVYVALIKINCWQIFLLLIPAELIVLLCTKLKISKKFFKQ